MTMRMVLVGLVAALGVTVPTPTQCSQWWLSIRNVGSAALADWDHWTPPGRNELQGVSELPPVVSRERPTGDQARDEVQRGDVSADGLAEGRAAGTPLIAAHHMKLPATDDAASQNTGETWADLPDNVFESRPIVFEPLVISANLYVGVAYELNRMAEGIGIKASTAGGVKSTTRPSEPAAALPRLAAKVEKEPAFARNRVAAEPAIVPFSRIDNLDAGLWAGLIQSAERVLAGDGEASSFTPALARVTSKLEGGLPGEPHVALDEWIDFDGPDLIFAELARPDPSDLAIAEMEGGSIPILGAAGELDPAESLDVLPWSEAQTYDRRDSEPVVQPTHPLKTSDPVCEPPISSDLKQAILLTKDALNAWVNLVRRGSALKVTKR